MLLMEDIVLNYLGKHNFRWHIINHKKILNHNPSYFKGFNLPCENISWNYCQNFIKILNEDGSKFRLPSESEWEYCCRAGTTTRFYTGNSESDLSRAGWYNGNSGNKTHPVGQKQPNAWGLYDMHGNVWEWCEDDYHDDYNGAPTDGSALIDNPRGSRRVLRGGSWSRSSRSCRSAYRRGNDPGDRFDNDGFRLVCDD